MITNRRFIIASKGNPFEIFLLLACILGGIGGLLDPNRASQAIIEALPEWERYTWHVGLIVAGSISLVGALGKTLFFLYVERMGLTLLAGLSLGYSVALFVAGTRPLAFSAFTVVCFSAACFVRLLQIRHDLRVQKVQTEQ